MKRFALIAATGVAMFILSSTAQADSIKDFLHGGATLDGPYPRHRYEPGSDRTFSPQRHVLSIPDWRRGSGPTFPPPHFEPIPLASLDLQFVVKSLRGGYSRSTGLPDESEPIRLR
jgi:hypothetical protein